MRVNEKRLTVTGVLTVNNFESMKKNRISVCRASCRPCHAGGSRQRVQAQIICNPNLSNMHKVEFFHSYAHAARFPFVVVGMALASLLLPYGLSLRSRLLMRRISLVIGYVSPVAEPQCESITG